MVRNECLQVVPAEDCFPPNDDDSPFYCLFAGKVRVGIPSLLNLTLIDAVFHLILLQVFSLRSVDPDPLVQEQGWKYIQIKR